jgi:hypothetical protein
MPLLSRIPPRSLLVLGLLVGVGLGHASDASAELVYFGNGRTISVKASRIEGETVILTLRGGGEATFDRTLVSRIEEDEVPYPEPADNALAADSVAGVPLDASAGSSLSPSFNASAAQYQPIIERVSKAHGVDPTLVRAVIQVESAYQSRARSPKGAVGLMQVMPATGRQYGITNLWDPASNIEAGITHLRSLLDRFPLSSALAAYNAGEVAVQRFSGIPPYPETRSYVSRILKLVER